MITILIILLIVIVCLTIYIIGRRKIIIVLEKMLCEEMIKVKKHEKIKVKIDKLRKEIPGKNLIRKEIVEEIDKILGEVEGI